jgi:hypothetical protein
MDKSKNYTKQWYRPREIAKLGLIRNSTGGDNVVSNYHFILGLIKSGKLKAKDYSKNNSSRSFWLVSAEEIARYNNSY